MSRTQSGRLPGLVGVEVHIGDVVGGLVVHVDLALLGLAALPVLLVAGPVARVRGVRGAVRLVQLLAQGRSAVLDLGRCRRDWRRPVHRGRGRRSVPGVVLAVAPAHGHGVEILAGLEPVAVGVLGPEPARAARGRGLIEHVDIVQRAGGEVEVLVVVLLPRRRALYPSTPSRSFLAIAAMAKSVPVPSRPQLKAKLLVQLPPPLASWGDVAPEDLILHIPPAGGAAALGGDIHRAVAQGGGVGIFPRQSRCPGLARRRRYCRSWCPPCSHCRRAPPSGAPSRCPGSAGPGR